MKESLIAIDPGVELGWAFWPEGKLHPSACGLVKPKRKQKDFFSSMQSTVDQLDDLLDGYEPAVLAIEWPAYFDSVGGRAAAGSGSIVKLAFGIGQIAQLAAAREIILDAVEVMKWKGQLPKEVVIKRINKIIPAYQMDFLTPTSHAYDAIGIGLYCRGLF